MAIKETMEKNSAPTIPCPVCCNEKNVLFGRGLLRCSTCGMIFSPAVAYEDANEQFEEEWFEDSCAITSNCWVDLFDRWKNRRTYKRIVGNGLRKGRLLEIGVGTGSFLNEMAKHGFEVLGCDLSKHISESVKKKYNIPVHAGQVASLPATSAFDAVVMNHVLEHVNKPVRILKDILDRMKPEGLLHIAVPNIQCWEAVLPGWVGYQPYHLIYFSPQTLKATLSSAGFSILKCTTNEPFSSWFLAILNSLLKQYKKKNTIGTSSNNQMDKTSWKRHPYYMAMVASGICTYPLRYLQSHFGYGDEIVVIARPDKNRKTA